MMKNWENNGTGEIGLVTPLRVHKGPNTKHSVFTGMVNTAHDIYDWWQLTFYIS